MSSWGRTSALPALALLIALTAGGPVLAAAPGPVLLVPPEPASKEANELLVRLAGELAAAGFTVRITAALAPGTRAPDGTPAWALCFVLFQAGQVAVDVALPAGRGRAQGPSATSAWRVVAIGSSAALTPTALALRTVETLRAQLAGGHDAAAPPPEVASVVAPAAPVTAPPSAWRVALGLTALHSFAGLEPAAGPALALARRLSPRLSIELGLVGPALSATVTDVRGDAEVRHALARFAGLWDLRDFERRLVPFLRLTAGVYQLHGRGQTTPPFEARTDVVWAFATGVGLGARWRLRAQLDVTLEVEAVFTSPGAAVEIADRVVGRAGRPLLIAQLGPAWRF